MQQQINLLQPPLTQPRQVLSPRQLALGVLGLCLLLGLMSVLQWQDTRRLARQQIQLQQKHAALEQSVAELDKELAAREPDAALQKELARVDAELQRKQRVLARIQGRSFGNSAGFAPVFVGLARQRLDGLWLTGLHVSAGGQALDLQGSALDPALVPRYLQRLRAEPGLKGMEFETFLMQRPQGGRTHIDFDLRSKAGARAEAGGRR